MFAKLHITALLTVVLPDLAFAGVVSQRANNICGSKGWDRGNGNYCKCDLMFHATGIMILTKINYRLQRW